MRAPLRKFIDAVLRRNRFEDAMSAEMRFHMEAHAADLERQGLSPDEARRRARLEFGGTEIVKDECRQSRGLRLVDEIRQDLRYARRQLMRTPGFTAAAVISLALGIGANTAIYSLLDAVLLRSLPVNQPERLYYLAHGRDKGTNESANFPLYERYGRANVLEGVTAFETETFTVRLGTTVDRVNGQFVTANYHRVVGVSIAAGHGFTSGDDRARGDITAVISDDYWRRRFDRSPDAVGQTFTIAGRPVTIVGVTAAGFNGLNSGYRADITLPIWVRALDEPEFFDDRGGWTSLALVGRLQSDQTEAQALAAVDSVFRPFWMEPENAWIRQSPEANNEQARLVSARRGSADLRRQYTAPLQTLMWMVGIVLLIACGNVANLSLARAAARTREVAVRLGIGAGRGRLVRQFLTESLLLSAIGGALGLLVSFVSTRTVMMVLNSGRWPVVIDASPNIRVFAFTTVVSVITGVAFGLVPALRATRVDLVTSLKVIGPSRGGRQRAPIGKTLLIGQIALSVVIVSAAALLGRSLHKLRTLDTGFNQNDVLLFNVETRDESFTDGRRAAFYPALLERLGQINGVSAAALADRSPIDSTEQERRLEVPGSEQKPGGVSAVAVTPAYFDAFGIPLVRGRGFADRDDGRAERQAIVNESMAQFYFGDASPIGRTIIMGGRRDVMTIVGIVKDVRHEALRDTPPRTVYTLLWQPGETFTGGNGLPSRLTAMLRTTGNPSQLATVAPRLVREIETNAAVAYVRTIREQLDAALINERLLATLSTAFGFLALLLSTVGLYGVTAYGVARRTRETAIRLALGSSRGLVIGQVLRETLVASLAGIAIGLSVTFLATRAIASFLFELSPTDPTILGLVATLLVVTAVLAALVPARRAAVTEPARSLRAE